MLNKHGCKEPDLRWEGAGRGGCRPQRVLCSLLAATSSLIILFLRFSHLPHEVGGLSLLHPRAQQNPSAAPTQQIFMSEQGRVSP